MTFENQEIELKYFFPNSETSVGESITTTVGEGVEFDVDASELFADDTFEPGYSIDISSNSILFTTVDTPIEAPLYNGSEFNGYVFTDVSGEIPAIESVSINESGTSLGIEASDITFDENNISLNLEGISYTSGEQVLLDVEFASETEPELQPESENPLEISVSSPESIAANGTDVVTVTYTNTSNSDVAVPLLSLQAENALLRPDGEAQFDETQIQFLALSDNGDVGVLAPGESNTFTVEFIPDGTADEEINFSVSSISNDEVIDWESLRESSRPDFIVPEAWNEVYDNFLAEVGTTVGDYSQLLIENANYLSEIGEYEPYADNLLAFEFQQASDFQSITQRYSLGSFGRDRR